MLAIAPLLARLISISYAIVQAGRRCFNDDFVPLIFLTGFVLFFIGIYRKNYTVKTIDKV